MRTLYFCPVVSSSSSSSSSSFLSSPIVSAVAEWMSTILLLFYTWCGLSANLDCSSEMCCTRLARNAGRKNDAKTQSMGTIVYKLVGLYLRNEGMYRQSEKNLSMCPPHVPTIWRTSSHYSGSLGHPSKFPRLSRLGSVLHATLVVCVSQTLRRWTEGATYIRQGGHHVGHWPTF